MTMGENTIASLVFPIILRPILTQLEHRDLGASQTLKSAISKAEQAQSGFSYDFLMAIINKIELSHHLPPGQNLYLNEIILRLQGSVSENELVEYRLNRAEDAFQELNKKSAALKRILSRIPDEISDRKTFLETIKEIASAIKKLLDAVNEIVGFIPGSSGKQQVEQRKKEFVKYSKKFSTTLKEYFKEGQPNAVFLSALYLIHQTNQIMITVKNRCE